MKKARQNIRISKKVRAQVERFLKETDLKKFWQTVMDKSAPGIEAYRRARLRSAGSRFI